MKPIAIILLIVACSSGVCLAYQGATTRAGGASSQPIITTATKPSQTGQMAAITPPTALKETLFSFYAKNLRASLFSGFLTLGSFLVAVNTFVIVNLKKEVYDSKHYRERVTENRKAIPETSFYGPLRRFSRLLLVTIVLSIFTAVSQLTIGVIFENTASAVLCISFASLTIVMLVWVLVLMGLNLHDWFNQWEEQACNEHP